MSLGIALALMSSGALSQPNPVVVDLHVDLPFQVQERNRRLDDPDAETSPDRLRTGNVGLTIMPLFVADAWRMPPAQVRAAYETTYQSLLTAMQGPSILLEPRRPMRQGYVATLLAFEGADGFADDPNALVPWIERGVCLVGLVHTRTNRLAGSSSDPRTAARKVGLTERGKQLVRTAYGNGALVDLAHASDAAVLEIVREARTLGAPLVCSHTGVRALRNIERNLSDDHLRWIAASGGVVGVSLHGGHIGSRPGMRAGLEDFILHVEHAAMVAGLEHVAIGSDLDGNIDAPMDSDGAATWALLARRLRERGWDEGSLHGLFRGNAERVFGWARGCRS